MSTVTVAIPSFNGAAFIARAIESVLAQSTSRWRVIISDDQSTDDTLAVARKFASDRVQVFRAETRLGLSGNWNRCISLCETDYLCIFHQDDVMRGGNLQAKLDVLDANPDVAFVCSAYRVIDEAGAATNSPAVRIDSFGDRNNVYSSAESLSMLLERNRVRASTVVIRRAALGEKRFREDLQYLPDWDMWLRLAAEGAVGWLAEPLVDVRWHSGSETHRRREGDQDLAEYERYLPEAIDAFASEIAQPRATVAKAYRALADGYLNRAYLALRSHGDGSNARRCLLAALRCSPRSVATIARDPRFAAMCMGLLIAPATTARLLHRPIAAPN